MITISQSVEEIVKETPFLEEALYKKIINLTSAARMLRPELEKRLYKQVHIGAIVMALERFPKKERKISSVDKIFKSSPDIFVRSNLTEYNVLNEDLVIENNEKTFFKLLHDKKSFFTITQGIYETTIIASNELKESVEKLFNKDKIKKLIKDLSAITIRLPKESIDTPGVHYYILKALAWESINMVESVSTYLEFSIILNDDEVDKAFSVLKKLLRR